MSAPTHGELLGKSDEVFEFFAAIESVPWVLFARPCHCCGEAIHPLSDIVPAVFHAREVLQESRCS